MSGREQADVLVIGAGPAGIAAAVRAAQCGASVAVLDDNAGPGGQIWRGSEEAVADRSAKLWMQRFHSAANVAYHCGSQVVSLNNHTKVAVAEHLNGCSEWRYKKLILATGARELFIPFPGWTLPGVTGVGGLQALVRSGLPVAGKRIVIAGSGPLLLAVASHLKEAGAIVRVVAEQARTRSLLRFGFGLLRHPAKIRQAFALRLSLARVRYRTSCLLERAEGSEGILSAVYLKSGNRKWREGCDYAAVSYGLVPNLELPQALGCSLQGDFVAVDQWQETSVPDVFAAGELTGIGGVESSVVEGEIAGYSTGANRSQAERLFGKRRKSRAFSRRLAAAFFLRSDLRELSAADTLVCRCEDVAFNRLQSFDSLRAAKLQTRCGMGPCQARICGPACQFLFGWKGDSVRSPIFPARIESLLSSGVQDDGGI